MTAYTIRLEGPLRRSIRATSTTDLRIWLEELSDQPPNRSPGVSTSIDLARGIMSRDVSISLEFRHDIDFEEILDRLTLAGWELLREEDAIWYSTDFDWKEVPLDGLAEARRDMRISYEVGEVVGITTRLPERETLANVLFHDDRKVVSLIPLLDYRTLAHMPEFIDLGWYLERFLAPCRDLPILRMEASDLR